MTSHRGRGAPMKNSFGLPPRPPPPEMLRIPLTMATWPWIRTANPHEAEVEAESKAWLRTFSRRMENDPYWEGNIENTSATRFASLAAPFVSKEQLRVGSDLAYIYFFLDGYFARMSVPAIQGLVDVMNHVLEHPYVSRPTGEHPLGQVFKEFWELTLRVATPLAAKHFRQSFPGYLESNVIQAQTRDDDSEEDAPEVDEYLEGPRRDTIGGKASFLIGEVALNIPDEVYNHFVLTELRECILNMMIIDNDIVSYNKSQASGDDRWTVITIFMDDEDISANEAMEEACNLHLETQQKFTELIGALPNFDSTELEKEVSAYIYHLANFAQGHYCWSFESSLYFGNVGMKVQRAGWVELYPKRVTK